MVNVTQTLTSVKVYNSVCTNLSVRILVTCSFRFKSNLTQKSFIVVVLVGFVEDALSYIICKSVSQSVCQ